MTLLDLHIIRAALYDARRLVEAGHAFVTRGLSDV